RQESPSALPQADLRRIPVRRRLIPILRRKDRGTPLALVRPRPHPQHHRRHSPTPHLACRTALYALVPPATSAGTRQRGRDQLAVKRRNVGRRQQSTNRGPTLLQRNVET